MPLAEDVEVLRAELGIEAGLPLATVVAKAIEHLGLGSELKGQTLVQKVEACMSTLGRASAPVLRVMAEVRTLEEQTWPIVEYLPRSSFTASSTFAGCEGGSYPPHMCRFSSHLCWSPAYPRDRQTIRKIGSGRTMAIQRTEIPWLNLDLTASYPIYAVGTKGNAYMPQRGEWVTKFEVQLSQDGLEWHAGHVFEGNTDATSEVVSRFAQPEMARYVRFHPKEYKYSSPCIRVEVYTSAEAAAALRTLADLAPAREAESGGCCLVM